MHRSDCSTLHSRFGPLIQLRITLQNVMHDGGITLDLNQMRGLYKNAATSVSMVFPDKTFNPVVIAYNGRVRPVSRYCTLERFNYIVVQVHVPCTHCRFEPEFLERYMYA